MSKKLGQNFANEIHKAGLNGKPFSWRDDGYIVGRENLTPEDDAKLQAVIDAHVDTVTPPPDVITWAQFWQACYKTGHVTKQEAMQAIKTRALPPKMANALTKLPPEIQEAAEFTITGARDLHLSHPLTPMLTEAMGLTEADRVEVWKLGATL